jgi:hypothetical protein
LNHWRSLLHAVPPSLLFRQANSDLFDPTEAFRRHLPPVSCTQTGPIHDGYALSLCIIEV